MKKTLCILALLTCWTINSMFTQVPEFEWVKSINSVSTANQPWASAIDANSNAYTTGYFESLTDFDPGVGAFNLSPIGTTSGYIQKLDKNGDFVWAKKIGGLDRTFAREIGIDDSGNVYVSGIFNGTTDFDPGPGSSNITSNGLYDIYVVKLDSNGNFLWVNIFGGVDDNNWVNLEVDSAGNVYLAGWFEGSFDVDPGPGVTTLTSNGFKDIFILKCDPNGTLLWAHSLGGPLFDTSYGFELGPEGNIHISGNFSGSTVDFDPGPGTFNLTSGDVFILKWTSDGEFIWAKEVVGSRVLGLAIDQEATIYAAGVLYDLTDFDPGPGTFYLDPLGYDNLFVQKLDSMGDFKWAVATQGPAIIEYEDIELDSKGVPYITGSTRDTVDFDPGIDTFLVEGTSLKEAFVLKLDTGGNFAWVQLIGGIGNDYGKDLNFDNSDNLYVTGAFQDTVDFDWGPGSNTLNKPLFSHSFIAKYSSCLPTTYSLSITTCGSYTSPSGSNTWITSGIYQDTISNVAGCDSILTINLALDTLNLTVTNWGDSLESEEIGVGYQWLACDLSYAAIPGENNPVYSPAISGNYAVQLTEGTCIDTSICHPVVLTERNGGSTPTPINVYPNPTTGNIQIEAPLNTGEMRLTLFNAFGQSMEKRTLKAGASQTIEIQGQAGVYFLKTVSASGRNQVFKILKF